MMEFILWADTTTLYTYPKDIYFSLFYSIIDIQLFGLPSIDISHLPLGIYSVEFLPSNNQKKQIYTARISISH